MRAPSPCAVLALIAAAPAAAQVNPPYNYPGYYSPRFLPPNSLPGSMQSPQNSQLTQQQGTLQIPTLGRGMTGAYRPGFQGLQGVYPQYPGYPTYPTGYGLKELVPKPGSPWQPGPLGYLRERTWPSWLGGDYGEAESKAAP